MTIRDRWAALQFDQAVMFFGLVIENAANERIEVGEKWVNKYELSDLLTEGFVIASDEGGELPLTADGVVYDEVGG